ncbi:MAG: GTP cyclohydrolase II, partial [Caldilineaceae bacterium]|nr:GTP cyclohydrolase II [Caldilineaceae bacterium]
MATSLLNRTVSTRLPTAEGEFQLIHYANAPDQKEHLALVMGHLQQQQNVLVRVHSECFTGDVLGSRRCDCGEQLHAAMQLIAAEGQGLVIYLRQEGRGIGLQKKLEAYNLQDQGHDTVDANLLLGHQADERTYEVAVAILHDLGVQSLRLITNNPSKLEQLRHAGLTVTERVPLVPTVHAENRTYLATKVARMRHLLALPPTQQDTPIQVIQNGVAKNGHAAPPLSPSAQLVANLQEKALAHFARYRLPFVTLSYAQSLDGSIAAADGTPLRISGERAMTLTHMLRAAHDAILVGVGTVLADDPQLTVRLVAGSDPQPILLDTHLRTPVTARCLRNPRPPWLVTAKAAATAAAP